MKLVNSYFFVSLPPRSYDKSHRSAHITVEEYVTFYSVTIHFHHYECPSVLDWRISKKQAKDYKSAYLLVADEAFKRGNI